MNILCPGEGGWLGCPFELDKLAGDVQVGSLVLGMVIRVELTHNCHSPSFILEIANGKLKMSLKAGKHDATMTDGFNLESTISETFKYGGLLEAVLR